MKFKFIATGDLHFGIQTYGTENPITGINTRTEDVFQAFDQLIDYAIKEKIKLITISGDVFDRKVVPNIITNEFYKKIKRISDNNIDTFVLSGNHDKNLTSLHKCSLDLAKIVNIPNVYVSDGNELFDLDYVQIITAGYYASNEELEQQLDTLYNKIDHSKPTILIGHLQIETPEFKYSSFKEDLHFTPLELLTKYNFQYCSIGHLHKQFHLSEDPPVVYNGSLCKTSFSEENEESGFNIVEVDGLKKVKITRQLVDCLQMKTFRGTFEQIQQDLNNKTADEFTNTIVRVIITSDKKEAIDEKFLKEKLNKSFKYLIKIERNKIEHKKIEVGENILSLQEYSKKYFSEHVKKKQLLDMIEVFNLQDLEKKNLL